jgi:hypothetical protein
MSVEMMGSTRMFSGRQPNCHTKAARGASRRERGGAPQSPPTPAAHSEYTRNSLGTDVKSAPALHFVAQRRLWWWATKARNANEQGQQKVPFWSLGFIFFQYRSVELVVLVVLASLADTFEPVADSTDRQCAV